ncbi:hypothetical protein ACKI1H_27060 [Pseudomonas sp. YH-1]|uniref:hypothetical protein n=1 Tax=Pseudomonas sp. YH-1 TaxID=3384787 RepID=UPI003F80E379
MTSEQFSYWLQGFVELNGSEPTAEQWQSIKDHLKTVFVKVTPEVKVDIKAPTGDLDKIVESIRETGKRSHDVWPFRRPHDPYFLGQPVVTC